MKQEINYPLITGLCIETKKAKKSKLILYADYQLSEVQPLNN